MQANFEQVRATQQSQGEDGQPVSEITEVEMWAKVVGGPDKKGRVYGLKHFNVSDIPGSSRAMEEDAERMREHINQLDADVRAQVERQYSRYMDDVLNKVQEQLAQQEAKNG